MVNPMALFAFQSNNSDSMLISLPEPIRDECHQVWRGPARGRAWRVACGAFCAWSGTCRSTAASAACPWRPAGPSPP